MEPKPTLSFRRGPILTGRQATSWSVWTRPVQSEHPSWQAGNQLYLCGAWLGLAARFWVGWLVFFFWGGGYAGSSLLLVASMSGVHGLLVAGASAADRQLWGTWASVAEAPGFSCSVGSSGSRSQIPVPCAGQADS